MTDAMVARYAGPTARVLEPPYGFVVMLQTTNAVGTGEVVVGPGIADALWSELEQRVPRLIGAALPRRVNPDDPLGRIARWRAVAAKSTRVGRAVTLVLETALLDLALKSAGVTPDQLWPGGFVPGAIAERAVAQLPRCKPEMAEGSPALVGIAEGDAPVVRVRTTGEPHLDEAWLRHLADIEKETGRNRPLWLVGRRRLSVDAAELFVRAVAERIASGTYTVPVLVEEPVNSEDATVLSDLQRAADETLGLRSAGAERRLRVLAGASVNSRASLRRAVGGGALGGVCFYPHRWGTWLGVRDAVRDLTESHPATMVAIADNSDGSDITPAVSGALAATMRAVGWHLTGPPPEGWPVLLKQPKKRLSTSPGLTSGVSIAALAAVADRFAELPPRTSPHIVGGEQPNRYEEHILPGAPLGVPKQTLLEVEALRAGLVTRRLSRSLFLAEDRLTGRVIGFSRPQSSATSVPAVAVATHKGLTRQLLLEQGLPVAPGAWFGSGELEKARAAASEIGFPLVVKPAGGIKGRGVNPGITTPEDLVRAFTEAASSRYGRAGIVLERMATGREYRILATRDEVLSVYRKEPASVVGDSMHTVEELVLAANVERRRNPQLGRRLHVLDRRVRRTLARQGLGLGSVPERGQRVQLSDTGNLNQGGANTEVLDSTHPSICDLARSAVAAIPGLPYGGVDLFMEDHTRPVAEQNVAIIEINHNPGLTGHHFPMFGTPRNVCEGIVRNLAEAEGITPTPTSEVLAVRLTVSGRVQRVGYRAWIATAARRLELDGWVCNLANYDQVRALIGGPAVRVGVMLRLAFGGPPAARPVEILAEPIDSVPPRGFVVRSDEDDHGSG